MKKIRIIGIMAIVAISLLLCTVVTIKWSELGCDIGSLIAGCVYYTSATCVLGAVVVEKVEKLLKH